MTLYDRVVDLIEPGDVFLSFNNGSKLSKWIANITNSEWSHVFMYIGNGNIVESTGHGGVRIGPLKKYFEGEHDVAILRLKATEIERNILVEKVLNHVGKRYGRLQILWYLILRWIRQSENPRFQLDIQPNAMVCSEAVATGMDELGYEIKPGMKPAGVEPADFAESDQFEELIHEHIGKDKRHS